MLPLLITLLLAVYVLGPDLISRSILSLYVPRRAVVQSRSEEWARSLLWAIVPFALAWFWADRAGRFPLNGSRAVIETVFSALYSDGFFTRNTRPFFDASIAFFWLNWSLLWRLYLLVAAGSFSLMAIIRSYGPVRSRLEGFPVLKSLLATLVLPRVSDWHVLLSRMLLPQRDLKLFVDVLTRQNDLYQGRLSDKMLGPDGTLVNITLAEPRRFRRDHYLEASKTDSNANPDAFWRRIPGESFIVLASEITTINIRYLKPEATAATAPDVIAELNQLVARLKGARDSQGPNENAAPSPED